MVSESQYAPTVISIRGRTTQWFTYTVQEVAFNLDGFNDEGKPIYVGYLRKLKHSCQGKNPMTEEMRDKQKRIYLLHSCSFFAGMNEIIRARDKGEM